ncbi:MAG: sulfotransferase [bacterium]|nr:sulfotransferase [bacterium]
MWSGPRNISTAMMRSWGNRPDTYVCDEPLYGHYLTQVDVDHPGRDEVVEKTETDWRRVVDRLTGPVPEGRAIFYQKQMAHHLLPHIDRGWLGELTHVFLIRDPREMLTSLIRHFESPGLADTGLPQQVEVFESLRAGGATPPVIDARDVLRDPSGMLAALCERLGIEFDESMLSWPAGPRATDGVWAKHWYAEVETSTGFRPYRPKTDRVPDSLRALLDDCREPYDLLYRQRLTIDN